MHKQSQGYSWIRLKLSRTCAHCKAGSPKLYQAYAHSMPARLSCGMTHLSPLDIQAHDTQLASGRNLPDGGEAGAIPVAEGPWGRMGCCKCAAVARMAVHLDPCSLQELLAPHISKQLLLVGEVVVSVKGADNTCGCLACALLLCYLSYCPGLLNSCTRHLPAKFALWSLR